MENLPESYKPASKKLNEATEDQTHSQKTSQETVQIEDQKNLDREKIPGEDFSNKSPRPSRRAGISVRLKHAEYLLASGKQKEAIAVIEQCVERKPNNIYVLLKLGEAYLVVGRKDDATIVAKKMLDLDTSGNGFERRAGRVAKFFWTIGHKEDAINLLKNNLDKLGKNSNRTRVALNSQLVTFYWYGGYEKEALTLARQNYEKYSQEPVVYVQLANLYIKNFDFDLAKKVIENLKLPSERGVQEYLWIKYYYAQVGQSKEVISRCIAYIQTGDFNPSFEHFLPLVMMYFYRTQPNHIFWDILEQENPTAQRLREILNLKPSASIKKHVKRHADNKYWEAYIDRTELGEKFATSEQIYGAPFLIPINRAATQGLTEYDFKEHGTKIEPIKQKSGKPRKIDPRTVKDSPNSLGSEE